MSNESSTDQIREHVKDSNVWIRLVYMVLFAMFYWVAEVVLGIVVLFQFLMVLFTGKKNDKVLLLGAQLSTYAYQIFRFLTFNSETQPFPMGEWPSGTELSEAQPAKAEATTEEKKPARKRAPARKKTAENPEEEASREDKPAAAE